MKNLVLTVVFICLFSCTSGNRLEENVYLIDNPITYDIVYKNIVLQQPDNKKLYDIIFNDTIVRESPLPKKVKETNVSKVAIVSGSDTILEDLYRIDLIVDSIVSKKSNYIIYGGDKHAIVVWPKVYGKPDVGINKKKSLYSLKINNYDFYSVDKIYFIVPYFMAGDDTIKIRARALNFLDRCYYYVPVDKP